MTPKVFTLHRHAVARTATVALTAGALVWAAAATAEARSEPAVQVPAHTTGTGRLELLGASAQGVVVRTGDPASSEPADLPRVFTGAEGGPLTERPQLRGTVTNQLQPPTVVGVDGSTLAWSQLRQGAGSRYFYAHQLNLLTGADEPQGVMPQPQAYRGGGVWISDRLASFTTFPLPTPALKTFTRPTPPPVDPNAAMTAQTVLPEDDTTIDLVSSGSTVLKSSYHLTDLSQDDGAPVYDLQLVNLADGHVTPVLDDSPDEITAIALSADTIGWVAGEGTRQVYRRAVSGGPVTSYDGDDFDTGHDVLVAGQGELAYLTGDDSAARRLQILHGGEREDVTFPGEPDGLAAVGNRFLTAVNGNASTAGVYSVTHNRAKTRTATVPGAPVSLTSVAAAAGRVYYSDTSPSGDGADVWFRTVSSLSHPKLSSETLLGTRASSTTPPALSPAISFSAGRGAITLPGDSSTQLLDGGNPVAVIPAGGSPNQSGAYTLLGGKVYGPDATQTFAEPAGDGSDDLYGPTAVWSRLAGSTATVWTANAASSAQPVQLGTESGASCTAAPLVSIWGQAVAWTGCDGRSITLLNRESGSKRTIPVAGQGITQLVLGEGTLAYTVQFTQPSQPSQPTSYLLDLTGNSAQPVALPGDTGSLVLDDHWVTRSLIAGADRQAEVRALPTTAKLRPRLISALAPAGFTRTAGSRWTPRFDISKPVRSVSLKITDSAGRTVVTLEGSGADGSVRNLSWDGKDRKGATVAPGAYAYTLTARAEDGDGMLIDVTGAESVTGRLQVS